MSATMRMVEHPVRMRRNWFGAGAEGQDICADRFLSAVEVVAVLTDGYGGVYGCVRCILRV